ncbi:hypothetical protein CSUNSWCD_295 [Campylobacter showae CSUNSWCD]|uniref:Uncharacterized protein n=1 Tax=Campylobacter showae CSUNSWCD TaxID=1244083 RepID=M5IM43_9BACT|nr:hypothetical protein CSUNSWCD_295 [Campylobacter showae CSUNSWCD]
MKILKAADITSGFNADKFDLVGATMANLTFMRLKSVSVG